MKKKRVLTFFWVGFVLTIINFVIYTIIARFLIKNNDLLWLAVLISSVISMIIAYLMHSNITWKECNPGKLGIVKFLIWNGAEAAIVNPILTWFFGLWTWVFEFAFSICRFLGLPFDFEFIESTGAFGLMTAVIMVLNFLFYDKFIFNKSSVLDEEKEEK